MPYTRFIGDVHGKTTELKMILDDLPDDVERVIQVGDMGVGFGKGEYWHESLDTKFQRTNCSFIRGNHDSPSVCETMSSWIPDGKIENDVMFIGGAWSIDYAYRTEGLDWWRDEELSYEKLKQLISVYEIASPSVMVTHDCPLSVSQHLFINRGRCFSGKQYATRTGSALETMFNMHKPKLHIFGHWHCDTDETFYGTRFICLDELSYTDIDLETLEVRHPKYFNPQKGI